MKGKMQLPMFWGSYFTVYGGRYVDRPAQMKGVKMAVEINRPNDVSVPVKDFSVPSMEEMLEGLEDTVDLVLSGKPVYVGCMGGIGRTGLMLAALAKAWGINEPVAYVRAQYFSHAVETPQQMDFIARMEIPDDILSAIRMAKFKNLLKFRKPLTNSV